jgi:DNA-binding protein Alba
MKDRVRVKEIRTNSEDFKNKEGRDVRVSTIEITLVKME